MPWLTTTLEQIRIHVIIVPRASRTEIVGIYGDRLKIKLTAPPVDGKANKALLAFLAKRLKLTKDQLNIASGATGRRKTVQIDGISLEDARARLV